MSTNQALLTTLPELVDFIVSDDCHRVPEECRAASRLLETFGRRNGDMCREFIDRVRKGAKPIDPSMIYLMWDSVTSNEDAAKVVAEASNDDDPRVRTLAVWAYGLKLPYGAKRHVIDSGLRILYAALKDNDKSIRYVACAFLGTFLADHPDAEVASQLTTVLGDKDSDVRTTAVKALASGGETAEPALPAMRQLVKDKDNSVREAAQNAIRTIKRMARKARLADTGV